MAITTFDLIALWGRSALSYLLLPGRQMRAFPKRSCADLGGDQAFRVRKGHGGLAAPVKNAMRKAPFASTAFVFHAKQVNRLKLR